jgi:hypothetical protein
METSGQSTIPADTARRRSSVLQLIFAGAATVATLTLLSAARPAPAAFGSQLPHAFPNAAGSVRFAADGDDNSVNDNGQTPGDIFTQNAQDQSTA